MRSVNRGSESAYEWHEVNGAEHAFNRFVNRPGTPWMVTLCGSRFSTHQVDRNHMRIVRSQPVFAGRCVACNHLVDAGSI